MASNPMHDYFSKQAPILIRLSPAEGLVFFEWLANLFYKELKTDPDWVVAEEGDALPTWPPEIGAMSAVQGQLEEQIGCLFASNYGEILDAARAQLVSPEGDATLDSEDSGYNRRRMSITEFYPPELVERARKIKLLLMDCDGVLTDGRIYFLPMPDGSISETKCFDCQDGMALQWAHRNDIGTGIISGRGGMAVKERARTAHMKYLFEGNTEKLPLLEEVLQDSGLHPEEIAYVGDDVTDIPLLKRVGLSAAPSNSRPEVLDVVHFEIPRPGGSGAVREVIELLLKSQGKWEAVWANYDV